MTIETKDVEQIMNEYLNYLSVIQEMSKGTIKLYRTNLKVFFEFIRSMDKFKDKEFNEEIIKVIELNDLFEFLNYIKDERGNSPTSRANKIATLRNFFIL